MEFQVNSNFNGIFTFLFSSNKITDNVLFSGSPKHEPTRGGPIVVFNPSNLGSGVGNNWHSVNMTNPVLSVYFLNYYIKLTGYSIKSRNDHQYIFPTEYILEGSNENWRWRFIHHFKNTTLSSQGATQTFYLENSHSYKYFRFTQFSTSSPSNYHFVLNRVEFYGTLHNQEIEEIICSSITQTNHFYSTFLYFSIITIH